MITISQAKKLEPGTVLLYKVGDNYSWVVVESLIYTKPLRGKPKPTHVVITDGKNKKALRWPGDPSPQTRAIWKNFDIVDGIPEAALPILEKIVMEKL